MLFNYEDEDSEDDMFSDDELVKFEEMDFSGD